MVLFAKLKSTLALLLFAEFETIGQQFKQYLASGVKLRRYLAARKLPNEGRVLKQAWDQLEGETRIKCEKKF